MFPIAKKIYRANILQGRLTLLLIAAHESRKWLRLLTGPLISYLTRTGDCEIAYKCAGKSLRCVMRKMDIASDFCSVIELVADDIYRLETSWRPKLVIDGGGNTGLFALRVRAMYPGATIKIFEPVPRNADCIKTNHKLNGWDCDLTCACLAGENGSLKFYCREANQGSFDSKLPYTEVIDVRKLTLSSVIPEENIGPILVKLDIEGLERDVVREFVRSGEVRTICVVGELHGHSEHEAEFTAIFKNAGWTIEYFDVTTSGSIFRAWSPAGTVIVSGVRRDDTARP